MGARALVTVGNLGALGKFIGWTTLEPERGKTGQYRGSYGFKYTLWDAIKLQCPQASKERQPSPFLQKSTTRMSKVSCRLCNYTRLMYPQRPQQRLRKG